MGDLTRRRKDIVIQRDNMTCQYCGRPLLLEEVTIDHVWPKSKGGRGLVENLVVSCLRCNAVKWNLDLDQFRDKCRRRIQYHLDELRYWRRIMKGPKLNGKATHD